MDELIKQAIKALSENLSFNEIELCDGCMKVHLVRFTPVPWYHQPGPWPVVPGYSWEFKQL